MTAVTPDPVADAGRRWRPRDVVVFFVLAYALSWLWTLPFVVAGDVVRRGVGWPTHYPALLGPCVAALIVIARRSGRPGLAELARRTVRWRIGWRWWIVAVSPLGFLAVALVGIRAAGRDLPAAADFGLFSGTPAVGLGGVFLMITFVGALGEEVGWRGYALPQLQRRFAPLTATLVLAPLWAGWHLPQFFVIQTYRDFGPVEYVGMVLGLTCGAVVLTWLYNRSGGSVLAVIVWHGVYNTVGATQAAAGVVAAVVSTLVMVQGGLLIVLEVRARGRHEPSVLAPPATTAAATRSVRSRVP
ncbi:MAG: CPBP family intramembrane glutamic endopeptidase [Kineosporiaceae bacterium]